VPAGTAQPLDIGLAGDHQIDPHAQPPPALAEAAPALEFFLRRELGRAHDHRQIQIGIRVGVSHCLRLPALS